MHLVSSQVKMNGRLKKGQNTFSHFFLCLPTTVLIPLLDHVIPCRNFSIFTFSSVELLKSWNYTWLISVVLPSTKGCGLEESSLALFTWRASIHTPSLPSVLRARDQQEKERSGPGALQTWEPNQTCTWPGSPLGAQWLIVQRVGSSSANSWPLSLSPAQESHSQPPICGWSGNGSSLYNVTNASASRRGLLYPSSLCLREAVWCNRRNLTVGQIWIQILIPHLLTSQMRC